MIVNSVHSQVVTSKCRCHHIPYGAQSVSSVSLSERKQLSAQWSSNFTPWLLKQISASIRFKSDVANNAFRSVFTTFMLWWNMLSLNNETAS